MEIHGAIEFKMDKKSYRMIPLANSEDYLYNKGSLRRAREVHVHCTIHVHVCACIHIVYAMLATLCIYCILSSVITNTMQ